MEVFLLWPPGVTWVCSQAIDGHSILHSIILLTIACATGDHVSHLETASDDDLDRLLSIVVDVENLFICVHREEDQDTRQV